MDRDLLGLPSIGDSKICACGGLQQGISKSCHDGGPRLRKLEQIRYKLEGTYLGVQTCIPVTSKLEKDDVRAQV